MPTIRYYLRRDSNEETAGADESAGGKSLLPFVVIAIIIYYLVK